MQDPEMRFLAPVLLCMTATTALGDGLFPKGRYRVEVSVTIPNVDVTNAAFVTEIVWNGPADPAIALGPLGPGPLRNCPSEAFEYPDRLVIETRCAGPNAGFATSVYRPTEGGFQGTVEMNMGGKNMTVGEVQRGSRLGASAD